MRNALISVCIIIVNCVAIISTSAEEIECPEKVDSAISEIIEYSRTPYSPLIKSQVIDILSFPAEVRNCTADGKFQVSSSRGYIWISGAYLSTKFNVDSKGNNRQNTVIGATRGHSSSD